MDGGESLDSGGSHGYLVFTNDKSMKSSSASPRDEMMNIYEQKPHMIEMNSLRHKTEYYRNQSMSLRSQLEILMQEKQRLECEFDRFKKEDTSDVRQFLEQFNDLKLKYGNQRTEIEKLTKENELCKKLCDQLMVDRQTVVLEKNELMQHYRQLEKGQKQYNIEKKTYENTLLMKDKEINDITSNLKALALELDIIHGERDSVLKENQKLTDDCTIANTQTKKLDKENKSLIYENELLKQEIQTTLLRYNDAIEKCNTLDEKLQIIKEARPEYKQLSSDSWSKDLSEIKDHDLQTANQEIEKLKKSLDKVTTEVTKATQEIDIAKGRRDWAISEREKIVQERDSIKTLCDELRKERDTAISDLLAAIRDSENIKKQKDEACKEVEQLKEHLETQLTTIQQQQQQPSHDNNMRWNYSGYDTEFLQKLETEIIDIDINSLLLNHDDDDVDLGICLDRRRDDHHLQNNNSIDGGGVGGCIYYVSNILKDSIFDGKLMLNDLIIQVNNLDCTNNISKRLIFDTIRRTSNNHLTIIVKRQRPNMRHVYSVQLNLIGNNNRNHGLILDTGIYITKIHSNSLAAKDSNLAIGDRILSINNRSMEGLKNRNEAMSYLDDNRMDVLSIIALKQIAPQQNSSSSNSVRRDNNNYRQHNNKMINTCTQTDEMSSSRGGGGGGNLDLLEGNRHFVPTTNPYLDSPNATSSSSFPIAATTTPISSSTKTSILTEMFQKFRGIKKNPNSSTDGNYYSRQTDAAFGFLDSELKEDLPSNQPPTKDGVIKRSKKKNSSSKDQSSSSKDSKMGMGTWPRTNIIVHDNNNTGTIVHHRKKDRPPLSAFTAIISPKDNNNLSSASEDYFSSMPSSSLTTSQGQKSSNNNIGSNTINTNKNRNSNPIPYHVLSPPPSVINRHSMYRTIDPEPLLLHNNNNNNNSSSNSNTLKSTVPLSNSSGGHNTNTLQRLPKYGMYDHNHHHPPTHHGHRVSLNFPTDNSSLYSISKSPVPLEKKSLSLKNSSSSSQHQQHQQQLQQQNSLDFLSMKSQNSIDSYISPKSPPSLDFASPKLPTLKDVMDFYTQRKPNKNVSKYPSDSESLGPSSDMISPGLNSNNSLSSFSRVYSASPNRYVPMYPLHQHSHHPRHASPSTTLPGSQTSDSLGLSLYDRYGFDVPSYHHSHGASIEYPIDMGRIHHNNRERGDDNPSLNFSHGNFRYEGGTFPRKKEHQRFRIPSNQSVTSKGSGVKNSTGSIEHHGSERGSPMPPYQVEILSHGSNANKRNSMQDYCYGQKPNPGDLRRVTIDKSAEPLGITIRCNNNGGGIFVSTVSKNSIASQVGLQIGDQLLEVCGINMRAATYEGAFRVLQQCGNPITMLVQYSPEIIISEYDGEIEQSSDDQSVSHSGSPTPRNSPRTPREMLLQSSSVPKQKQILQTIVKNSTILPSREIKKQQQQQQEFSLLGGNQSDSTGSFSGNSIFEEEPRILFIETKKSANLEIRLVGGNAVGIFVDNVEKDTLAYNAGLRVGDQILEFNGSDLRRATAENAAYELAKPADDKVTVYVQYNIQKFNQIKDLPGGDSFYIRAGFDRTGELGESELRFTKDEVLYVDNTIFGRGQWRAWKLDDYGHRLKCGIISSQLKVEEELRLHGDISDGDATTRRGSTSARRSFFRRKKHQRSSSRDSKELASFSNTQLSWHSDSGMLSDEGPIQSYQRVERLDYPVRRPVLVLGPLADWVVDKLTNDFPQQFKRCEIKPMNCEIEAIENMIKNNIVADYRRVGNIIEVTTVKSIKEVCDKNRHCILDVSLTAVERLQRLQIFPIVLLLRFKSTKQIKEIKDSRYASDKISAKNAKEMYEHALKLQSDYKQYISAVISAGVNITHICTQIKDAVEKEQKKILWVPSSN